MKEEKADVEPYPDYQEMEYMRLDDKGESHCRIFFEDNGGGVDDKKYIMHTKRWDVYMNKKKR